MRLKHCLVVVALVALVMAGGIEARKKKHKSSSEGAPLKTKTKTKWSSSTDISPNGVHSMVATEEHGYYVKRTFLPMSNGTVKGSSAGRQSPPFLAIPIAWFSCTDNPADCSSGNTALINGFGGAANDGFLCDDDCVDPYQPICGKTRTEVAVFYNKCKLNVAKCRTHGLWSDLEYDECRRQYPSETDYADKKFRASPFFSEAPSTSASPLDGPPTKEDTILEDALVTLSEINDRLSESMQGSPSAEDEEGSGDARLQGGLAKGLPAEVSEVAAPAVVVAAAVPAPVADAAKQNEINKSA